MSNTVVAPTWIDDDATISDNVFDAGIIPALLRVEPSKASSRGRRQELEAQGLLARKSTKRFGGVRLDAGQSYCSPSISSQTSEQNPL